MGKNKDFEREEKHFDIAGEFERLNEIENKYITAEEIQQEVDDRLQNVVGALSSYIKDYVCDNALPIAENLTLSDIFDFIVQ